MVMGIYYFDMKDGIPTRDRQGIEFASAGGAIEHSKELALRLITIPTGRAHTKQFISIFMLQAA